MSKPGSPASTAAPTTSSSSRSISDELAARLRAVVRRHAGHTTSQIRSAEIVLDLASHEASYRGKTEVLPQREFALMHALMERPGAILSRSQLEEAIYGWGEEIESNAIDV